ncbi:MAG: acyloxyacyl hydrolase [Flavobacteriaceae bacterium]|nr:acyloxyacyl hydrolase [Flavobacteriaceae bacterium]
MRNCWISKWLCTLTFSVVGQHGESTTRDYRIGVNIGAASQGYAPFDNPDYQYENRFVKVQLEKTIYHRRAQLLAILVEPSLYWSEHRLLNPFFIQPNRGPDYLNQRATYTTNKRFLEYALNIGLRWQFMKIGQLHPYLLGSVGPMIGTEHTERLRKGLAFSDILGLGILWQGEGIAVDLRLAIRHCSNAQLYFPNNGHNSIGLETGFSLTF